MHPPTTPTQTLQNILVQILVITTRALRDIHLRATNANLLKLILAANHAAARIGRAIRLTTLLIRRIQTHGLLPLTPTHAPPATPNTRPANPPAPPARTPRLSTGNADDAFIRRPIPIVIAAITRELHLAARILGIPLPDHLQSLCLHAALATGALTPATPPTHHLPAPTRPIPTHAPVPRTIDPRL